MSSLFRKHKTFTVNQPDLVNDVVYLGNVPTPIARGDGCADRPLSIIWRSYQERRKKYASMRLVVTACGLKVTTEKQGITEYWSHRITYCDAPSTFPRLFCWIYKHEGRRLKPELRCHAVLFKRSSQARRVADRLKECLIVALNDYKRDKMVRQRLRTSHSVSGVPVPMPLRRQMLYTGGQNFRPPLNHSKSAPRLYDIEEDVEEEFLNEDEMVNNAVLNCLMEEVTEEEEEEEEETDISDSVYGDGPSSLTDDLDLVEQEMGKHLRLRPESTGSEPDSISDESGYIEEKSSAEETCTSPQPERRPSSSQHEEEEEQVHL